MSKLLALDTRGPPQALSRVWPGEALGVSAVEALPHHRRRIEAGGWRSIQSDDQMMSRKVEIDLPRHRFSAVLPLQRHGRAKVSLPGRVLNFISIPRSTLLSASP